MERKVDTLAVMDRPETLAIQGGVSSHPGLTVQSIKDRNPENKGLSDSRNLWDSRSLKSNDFPVAQFRD
jgi:hypothetical protein